METVQSTVNVVPIFTLLYSVFFYIFYDKRALDLEPQPSQKKPSMWLWARVSPLTTRFFADCAARRPPGSFAVDL